MRLTVHTAACYVQRERKKHLKRHLEIMPVILSEASRSNVILSAAKDLNKHLEIIPVILSEASRSNVILSAAKDLKGNLTYAE